MVFYRDERNGHPFIILRTCPETGRVFYFLTRQNNGQRIISVTKQSLKLTE